MFHFEAQLLFWVQGIELVFLIRGSLWEIRLEEPAHLNRHLSKDCCPVVEQSCSAVSSFKRAGDEGLEKRFNVP